MAQKYDKFPNPQNMGAFQIVAVARRQASLLVADFITRCTNNGACPIALTRNLQRHPANPVNLTEITVQTNDKSV
jgi:hypothetical protein